MEPIETGTVESKIRVVKDKLEREPGHAWEWTLLGVELYDSGDHREAIKAYRKALSLDPSDGNTWYNLGVALKDRADELHHESIEAYRNALEIDPMDANAWTYLGVALHGYGDREGAIDAYQQALDIDPAHGNAWNYLGIALQGKGDREGAIEAYRQALAINPLHARARKNLSDIETGDSIQENEFIFLHEPCREEESEIHSSWMRGLESRQQDEADGNRVYERVLEFDKAASGKKSYNIGEFCKMLNDVEPDMITGFIKEFDNDFLIDFDVNKQRVMFNDPSPPELEIMGREFEKWLRFGRL